MNDLLGYFSDEDYFQYVTIRDIVVANSLQGIPQTYEVFIAAVEVAGWLGGTIINRDYNNFQRILRQSNTQRMWIQGWRAVVNLPLTPSSVIQFQLFPNLNMANTNYCAPCA